MLSDTRGAAMFESDTAVAPAIARLKASWKWLAAFALAGLAAGLVTAAVLPKEFESSALLILVAAKRDAPQPASLTNFRLLAESNVIAQDAVQQFGLAAAPHNWTPQRFKDKALAVDEIRGTNLLRIRVRLRDPTLAAAVCNGVAKQLIALQQRVDTGGMAALVERLRDLLAEAQTRLRKAEASAAEYAAREQVELATADAKASLTQRGALVPLLVDIEAEKGRLSSAEAELTKYSPLLSAPRMVGAEEALARSAAQQAARAQEAEPDSGKTRDTGSLDTGRSGIRATDTRISEEAGLRSYTGGRRSTPVLGDDRPRTAPPASTTEAPENPRANVDLTNPYVNPVFSTLQYEIATSRTRLAALERRRREMVDVLGVGSKELRQIATMHAKQLEMTRRETDADIARRVHEQLSLQYEEARLNSATSAVALQLVDQAVPAERPAWPKMSLFGAMGLLLGLVIPGCATAANLFTPAVKPR